MPTFEYSGRTTSGATVTGSLDAKNKEELQKFLRRQKIVVTNVKRKRKDIQINIGKKVKSVDLSRFTRQFATMIEAGLPLVQCLDILSSQSPNKIFAKAIGDIRDSVAGGSTLAAALGKHKSIFDELYVNMVEAGEIGGALETILKRLADYREKTDRLRRKVKGAMVYPAIISVFAVGVTIIMLAFIIPIFAAMFEGLGAELPGPTKFVLALSNFIRGNFIIFILLIIGLAVAFRLMNKNPKTKLYIDKMKLSLPVLGMLIKKTAISRFTRTLGTLLKSGVNLIDALGITGKASGNLVLQQAIQHAMISISEGETITTPLEEAKIFPPMVLQMIGVGEKTGNLDGMLSKIAEFYDEEVDAAVDALTAMIEPIVIMVLGVVIGGLLISMYLPMFDIIGQIQ
ncbi:type II secretion system F family protein [bacterium]|nr:type II secretion system F family protein [bacterium]